MAKVKSAFFCQSCGHETPKWLGKCPSCNEWNTFVEEIIQKQVPQVVAFSKSNQVAKPQSLKEIEQKEAVTTDPDFKDEFFQKTVTISCNEGENICNKANQKLKKKFNEKCDNKKSPTD